ncbi:hypothetical protein BSZ11_07060 [Staphylococcus sp. 47.1]|nr:hypothetical protein CEQ12_01450 [Staphylococcus cohnii]OLF32280.1 hypothetical protein BSZ11_07060 [Staphylococcus sp. 47.1]
MNHRNIANKIVIKLPANVNNVSDKYISSLVRKHTRKKKDFSTIKRIINQKRKKAFNYGKNSTRQYNQYL